MQQSPALCEGFPVLSTIAIVTIFASRLDKWAAVFGVFRLLWLSFNLAYVELTMNAGTLIDDGYCLIFWIQTVTVLLPLGKVPDIRCRLLYKIYFHRFLLSSWSYLGS